MGCLGIDPTVLPASVLTRTMVERSPGPDLAGAAVVPAFRGWRAGFRTAAGVTAGRPVALQPSPGAAS